MTSQNTTEDEAAYWRLVSRRFRESSPSRAEVVRFIERFMKRVESGASKPPWYGASVRNDPSEPPRFGMIQPVKYARTWTLEVESRGGMEIGADVLFELSNDLVQVKSVRAGGGLTSDIAIEQAIGALEGALRVVKAVRNEREKA